MYFRFMIGLAPSPGVSAAVEIEAALHGDICRVHMEDTYGGLRKKVHNQTVC